MDRAWDAGITWFDTGDAYGGGTSERWIGEWMRARGERPKLTTKVFHSTTGTPGDEGLAPDRIRRQIRASLERLGVESVDFYLAHAQDPAVPLGETVACFESLRGQGLIGAWGLSNHDLAEIRDTGPALVQNSFSLLDRADEEDVLPHCRARGIPYVPFGPLAGGWLTGKYKRGEAYPEGSRMTQRPGGYAHYNDEQVFDALDALADEAAAARRVDGGARVRVGAPPVRRRRMRAEPRRASRSGDRGDADRVVERRRDSDRRVFPVSQVRVLDEEDVRRLLPMADCIDAMAGALRSLAQGEVYNPLRPVFRPPNQPSLMGLMPAHRGGDAPLWSLKALTIVPGNSSRGLDSHQGFVALFDGESGEPRALMNAGGITAIRTAAVSGVATRLLAREDVRTLAILGSGTQARLAPRRDASGSGLRTCRCVERERQVARRRRERRHRRRGGSRRRRPVHDDRVGRAGRRARVVEARRAHQRGRLQHPDCARARLADGGRRVTLRRPPRVDAERGRRLPDPAAGGPDRPRPHPGRARRAAARDGGRRAAPTTRSPCSSRSASGSRTSPPASSSSSAPRRRMPGRSSRCDPARRDPPGT